MTLSQARKCEVASRTAQRRSAVLADRLLVLVLLAAPLLAVPARAYAQAADENVKPAADAQPAVDDARLAADDAQPAVDDARLAADDAQPAVDDARLTADGDLPAAGDATQPAPSDAHSAVDDALPASSNNPVTSLGDYERETVQVAIAELKLTIDSAATGKRIRQIIIVNRSVFNESTGWLQGLNYLHRTTREDTIRRLLLARPGDLWSDQLARESERILRDPTFSSFVVALPVQSEAAGVVDMLVVTRDVWSLRSNSEVVHQDGILSFLKVAAAENNLLGRRKHISLIFEMDQGEYSLSTRWRDFSVLGTRWQLTLRPHLIYKRGTNDFEGTESFTRVIYPLWSLASEWGFSFEATHKDAVTRNFEGADIATYDDPDTPEVETLRQEFSLFQADMRTQVQRSFGRGVKQQFSLGHQLLVRRPDFLNDLPAASRDNFSRDLFPRDERSSALTLGFDFFEARFLTYRNLNGYDLPEIKIAGLKASAEAAIALRFLGSERNFTNTKLRGSYFLPLPEDAFVEGGVTLTRRIEDVSDSSLSSVDTTYGADWFAASPFLGPLRMVAFGQTTLRQDVRDNELVRLGGQNDLRGYAIGSFVGSSFYRSTIEVRSLPHRLFFLRVGYVAFWDAGDAADNTRALGLHQDLGVGFKALVPQMGEGLFFLYWAVPLDRAEKNFPGRISLGFGQKL